MSSIPSTPRLSKDFAMNDENIENDNTPATGTPGAEAAPERRSLGYWLRAVDSLLAAESAEILRAEDVTRREWMLLRVIAGDINAPGFAERLTAGRGKRVRGLIERGWVFEAGDGTATLTDEGRTAFERLTGSIDALRTRVAGAVSAEDLATTMASLEAFARELGWDNADRMPRGRRSGRGWRRGRGFGHRFTPAEHEHDFDGGFQPGFGGGWEHGHGRDFRRGFRHDPGFGHEHAHGCAEHHHFEHRPTRSSYGYGHPG